PSCNDLVFEVYNDGVTGDGIAGDKANLDEDVRVRKLLDKGKGIMIQEDNPKRKRKSRPRGNGIVIDKNTSQSLIDQSKSESDFGTHNPNHIDVGLDYNMHSDSESDYSHTSVDYFSDGEEERLYHMGDSETIIEHKKTKVEKYPMHDMDTHWQMKKPKVDAEQPKECLTYYALANGFQLWFYRSATNKLIAMCGQGLEVQKDP
ncbi:hypothetical protein Tco_0201444, partial [Tanacetum coccineum]